MGGFTRLFATWVSFETIVDCCVNWINHSQFFLVKSPVVALHRNEFLEFLTPVPAGIGKDRFLLQYVNTLFAIRRFILQELTPISLNWWQTDTFATSRFWRMLICSRTDDLN